MVQQVATLDEFKEILKQNTKVVVDFTATWCGPCKMIGPKFVTLSDVYTDIKFIKVDVDDNEATAAECQISAMPTFHFYKNGEKFGEDLMGADEGKLKQKLDALKAA